jgi:hypothetical protein
MSRSSKSKLLSILEPFDEQLQHKILLIAVGGTAMTLLGVKASTKDVDFNIPNKTDYNELHRLYKRIAPGVEIDHYGSNMVFSEVLPNDYIDKASDYKTSFKNIKLKVLHPLDIVCSKISRSSDADIEDIATCIKRYKLKKSDLTKRATLYERAGNDKVFSANLGIILETLF